MRNRRHTFAAWIALAAFLLSSVWPSLAFASDGAPSFGNDICSASHTHDRSAPVAPAHTHKHCPACFLGAALQFAAPAVEQMCSVADPSHSLPSAPAAQHVPWLVPIAKSARGPPQWT